MKVGDLVRHWDPDCGTGVVLQVTGYDQPGILILWSDGLVEWASPDCVKIMNNPPRGKILLRKEKTRQ